MNSERHKENKIIGKITLKRIAELAQTSVNTVSRALNSKDGVSEQTRERILQVAAQHNYHPNLMARSMRGKQTNLIGILVEDVTNPFFIKVLAGAERKARLADLTLIIGSSNESRDEERKHIDAFLSYRCSGLALCLVRPDRQWVESLQAERVNFLMLDAPINEDLDCDRICLNNERDSITAVEYLLGCGHRSIAIISPDLVSETEWERYRGYQNALKGYGLKANPDYIKTCRDKDAAYRATEELMKAKDCPTALYVAKQSLGLSVLSALLNMGLRIPEDVSVLIFDDPDWASIFHPRITCLQRQGEEMGKMGIELLIDRMKNKNKTGAKKIVLDSRLIVRESVKRL